MAIHGMRTTLALDEDVVALLERVRKERGGRLKDTVNDALRQGLRLMTASPKQRRTYRTPCTDLGPSLIGSVDNIGQVLEVAERPKRR